MVMEFIRQFSREFNGHGNQEKSTCGLHGDKERDIELKECARTSTRTDALWSLTLTWPLTLADFSGIINFAQFDFRRSRGYFFFSAPRSRQNSPIEPSVLFCPLDFSNSVFCRQLSTIAQLDSMATILYACIAFFCRLSVNQTYRILTSALIKARRGENR